MKDSPERGWIKYKHLENEFLDGTLYVPLVRAHRNAWSEFFGDLINKVGNSVDSFFRMMIDDYSFDTEYSHIPALRAATKKRKTDITYFRDFFNPIFELSDVKIDVAYGLTEYGIVCPYSRFKTKRNPEWWISYNHVKHQWFDCIPEATLKNVLEALAGLFALNILYKKTREYLIRYEHVISAEPSVEVGRNVDIGTYLKWLLTSDIGPSKEPDSLHIQSKDSPFHSCTES